MDYSSYAHDFSEFFEDEDMNCDQKFGGGSRGLVTTRTQIVSRGHLDEYFSITHRVLPRGLTATILSLTICNNPCML